jgi:hypothetical protein
MNKRSGDPFYSILVNSNYVGLGTWNYKTPQLMENAMDSQSFSMVQLRFSGCFKLLNVLCSTSVLIYMPTEDANLFGYRKTTLQNG